MGSSQSRSDKSRALSYRHRRARRGIAAVWFAIAILGLVAVFCFVLDYAHIWYTQHQLQVAADSAALAVAQHPLATAKQQKLARQAAADLLTTSNFVESKSLSLDTNLANASNGDIVLGTYDFKARTFTPTTNSPNAAKVNARRTSDSANGALKLIFAGFWGTTTSNVSGTAIAVAGPPGPAGIVLLDPTKSPSLSMNGGTITVINGAIQVDSSSDRAVTLQTSGDINASAINVVGSLSLMLGRFSGNLVEGSPVVVDPLLSLTAPSSFGLSSQTANTNTLAPGVYNDVVAFTGGQKVTMTGGTYIFKNGLTLDGGSSITSSSGVLLYFQNGGITLTGSSSLNITALNDGSPYGSVAIYMDRANHSNISMTNSSSLVTNGTIYAPSNQLNLSDSASISSTGNLIGAAATLNGSPSITIDSNAGSPANNSVTLVQ